MVFETSNEMLIATVNFVDLPAVSKIKSLTGNPSIANPTKSSDTLKQFVDFRLSVFDHFVVLTLKELIFFMNYDLNVQKS